jgi:cytochrome P450 family 142 subfamily A polypeptide 1
VPEDFSADLDPAGGPTISAIAATIASTTRPAVDLLDPDFYAGDQHAAYTWMRAHEPVYRDEANGLWAVTRNADVREVEGRSDVFVSGQGYRSYPSPGETNMIAQDDPRHAEQRRLIARRFTPKAVRAHEPWLRSTIDELIDAVIDDGRMDVIDAIAAQLPGRLTAAMLGWPEDRWPDIKAWSERLMRLDQAIRDPAVAEAAMNTIMQFGGDLGTMIRERQGCPADDLVSVWANAEIDGEPLDYLSIMHETGLMISGGAETTRTVIARSLRTFCDHPEQWELLAAEPERIPVAVEEMIRWVTPLNNFFRTAASATTIADTAIATGDRIMLSYPSANRDEAVFDEPFRFDVTRNPNPHVAFGFGTHFCLGASLARTELALLFEQLTQRLTNLQVVTEPVTEPNIFVCAVESFDLAFDRR